MVATSVLLPMVPHRPEQILPYAALVSWTRAERLWQGQPILVDNFHSFAYAAGAGFRVPVGFGVTLMPLLNPFQAAVASQSLALTTGHDVLVGFGPAARSFQAGILGAPYASPLTAAREYLGIVRGLLAGTPVDVQGEYFTCRGALQRLPSPPISLGLGVLRPGMARLAGEVADAAITWLTPPAYLRDTVVPALRAGAEAAGRPVPRLVAMVPMALTGPGRDPVRIALAGSGVHMTMPHYIDMLRRAGIELDGTDPGENARRLVAGRAFLTGDRDELLAGIQEYADAGADEVIVNTVGLYSAHGHSAAMADLKVLFGS